MTTVPDRTSKKTPKTLYPTVVISGYYGFDNLGDELILQVLVSQLKQHSVHIIVLSQNPEATSRQYNVRSVKRSSVVEVLRALSKANLLISGGGGLFQDVTSMKSPLYYGAIIHLARFLRVPVCFWAQGVGPLSGKLSQLVFRSSLLCCKAITVRDAASAMLVQSITGKTPRVTADPVWLLDWPAAEHATGTNAQVPFKIGISLRSWPALTPERLQQLACLLTDISSSRQLGQAVEFWLLPFQKEEDEGLLGQLATQLEDLNPDVLIQRVPSAHLMEKIPQCHALIGMRFHSLVLALLLDIPMFGLSYDPKVDTLLSQFNLPGVRIERMETLSADVLETALKTPCHADLTPLKERSLINFKIIESFLKIPQAELAL
jgi:polysaccharide pyruvyl transferase CsaB